MTPTASKPVACSPTSPTSAAELLAETCVVQLGRYGDILNILPACQMLGRVALMVAAEYADILQAADYVDPITWTGDVDDLRGAVAAAGANFKRVLVPQMFGNVPRPRTFSSYALDEWAALGLVHEFPGQLVLRRNGERERRLASALCMDSGGPCIAVNFRGGSSPFLLGPELLDQLRNTFRGRGCGRARIIDLSPIRGENIVDLLGVIDRCRALLTIDTATLHLAHASKTPTIALVSDWMDDPWRGSIPKGNIVFSCRYSQALANLPGITRILLGLCQR